MIGQEGQDESFPDPVAQQRIPLADLNARLSRAEALDTYCPECGSRPGDACVFLPTTDLLRPGSTSKQVLARRAKIGKPTAKPHNGRHATEVQRMARWLLNWGSTLIVDESDRTTGRDERARCVSCGGKLQVRLRELTAEHYEQRTGSYAARLGWEHRENHRSTWCHYRQPETPRDGRGRPMTPRPIPGLAIDTISPWPPATEETS